ncbi:MAG: DUF6443 domain-containing protein, partial [Imperialibacter sp.]
FGRMTRDYLAYEANENSGNFKENSFLDQKLFYASDVDPTVASSTAPYAEKVFEPSPINRVREQGAPGEDWQPGTGRTVKMSERVNNANELKLWKISPADMPVSDNFYSEGSLFVNITADEQGLKTIEYNNKTGLTVMKTVESTSGRLETLYIYDDYDRLRFVIQPEGVARLNGNPTADFLKKWAFQYKYDGRHRMIEKVVPGAEPVVMVYDKRDRLVLSQDGVRRASNEWFFTKYDVLNRPVVSGIYQHGSNVSQSQMAGQISTTIFCEAFTGDGTFYGYSNSVWPYEIGKLDVQTVTYYDDYSFAEGSGMGYDKSVLSGLPSKVFDYPQGQVTESI